MRKTKIIATIGPASMGESNLKNMSQNGMDLARLNFSHGTEEEKIRIFRRIRNIIPDTGVILDTQGPEIRLGEVRENTRLVEGDEVLIKSGDFTGDEETLPVDYPGFYNKLDSGDTLLLSDGQIELNVTEVRDKEIKCEIIYGGKISSRKSVNVPGKDMGLEAPTDKDIDNIKLGIEEGFDFVAVSFVKSHENLREIKEILREYNSNMHVISKIEHLKAVENFDKILEESDGIMIARGDLGVEVPASDVPLLQKDIIKKCCKKEKPVIIATQMLLSMTEKPRATRAEVSDVANSVEDGADAVMLSEETAIGRFPVKTVQFMSETLEKMEKYLTGRISHGVDKKDEETSDVIARSVWKASRSLKVKYIVAHTSSGYTARKIAKFRPEVEVIGCSYKEQVLRQMNLVWGIRPFKTEFSENPDEMFRNSAKMLLENNMVDQEDLLILTAGKPMWVSGSTNMMEVRSVRSLLE